MASELAGFSLEAPGNPGNFLASSTQVRQLLTASAALPVPAQCVKFPSPTTASWQFHTHKMFTQRRKIHFPPLVLFKRKATNRFSKKEKVKPFLSSNHLHVFHSFSSLSVALFFLPSPSLSHFHPFGSRLCSLPLSRLIFHAQAIFSSLFKISFPSLINPAATTTTTTRLSLRFLLTLVSP